MFSQNCEGTNLSAEVPPFVPRRTRFDEQSSSIQLPRYLTTCFPFVQDQQDRRHGLPNMQSLPANPSQWPPMFGPALMRPNLFNRPFNMEMFRYMAPQGNIADSSRINAEYSSSTHTSNNAPKHNNGRMLTSKHEEKQKQKKVLKKSVAVQKEASGGYSENEASPKMVDSGQQTDFPSEIASKSLTDKPSPLKKFKNRQPKVVVTNEDDSSSDHADVDSDSGYYSPKRRMNRKKNGGTSTSDITSAPQASGTLQPVMFLPPGNVPSSFLFASPHSSPTPLHSNVLSPHVTPPPSNSASLLAFGPPEAPLILNSSSATVISPSPVNGRPPPGFPLPPGMLKPHEAMQIPEGWAWNGTSYIAPNYPPPRAPFNQFARPPSSQQPCSSNKKLQQTYNYSASSSGQGFQQRNRKQTSRSNARDRSRPEQAYQNSIDSQTQAAQSSSAIFLQDTKEFPGLSSGSLAQDQNLNNKLSYSQALTQKPRERQQQPKQSSQPTSRPRSKSGDESTQDVSAQKSRKRWKKAERASKAADEEYAEISREQDNIKKVLKKTAGNRNRKQQTVLDLGDIFSKLEGKGGSKSASSKKVQIGGGVVPSGTRSLSAIHHKPKPTVKMGANPLDATAPTVRRGKEREVPKAKKPSALKKVILKEREEKKEQRIQQLSIMTSPDHDVPPFPSAMLNPVAATTSSNEDEEVPSSKLVQLTIDDVPPTVPQIHSRRFREYCCQVLDKKIDDVCTVILQKLVYFQERMYQRDPIKAKMRRRLVMGIREVTKHLKLKKLKCVIISPNLEKIQSKGGLDDALQQILNLCEEQNVTYIFALGRKAMGRAVSKLVPVSIVGIFDYSGVDEQYKQLVSLVSDAQNEYKEMVAVYQQEVVKANTPSVNVASASTKRFAHMTHSRNPSAASCVSFASFISEPISEMNEDSNWRVLMDAGDENTLPPTAEDEGSLSEEETGGENVQNQAEVEKMSRKDSEITVVECKAIKEHFEDGDVEKPSSLDQLSSVTSSDYKDAKSQNSKQFQEFGDTSGNLSTPESEKSPLADLKQTTPSPDSTYLAAACSTLEIETIDSSSSVQDRVQMWLEDSHCSIATDKEGDATNNNEEETPKDE